MSHYLSSHPWYCRTESTMYQKRVRCPSTSKFQGNRVTFSLVFQTPSLWLFTSLTDKTQHCNSYWKIINSTLAETRINLYTDGLMKFLRKPPSCSYQKAKTESWKLICRYTGQKNMMPDITICIFMFAPKTTKYEDRK